MKFFYFCLYLLTPISKNRSVLRYGSLYNYHYFNNKLRAWFVNDLRYIRMDVSIIKDNPIGYIFLPSRFRPFVYFLHLTADETTETTNLGCTATTFPCEVDKRTLPEKRNWKRMYMYISTDTHTYTGTYVHIYVQIRMYMYICIYTYLYTKLRETREDEIGMEQL